MIDNKLAAIYGALIGDACGVPYEFKSPMGLPSYDKIDMVPPADFRRTWSSILPGTYSDDGAQLLCLLEVLSEQPEFDPEVLTERLKSWLFDGYMSVDSLTFDVGNQTSMALRYGELNNGASGNGNGSLMRTLPVALLRNNEEAIFNVAMKQSSVTHPHIRARLCCALYSLIAFYMLKGMDINAALDKAFEFVDSKIMHDVGALLEFNSIYDHGNYECTGTGYVVDSFWTCITVIRTSNSFEDAIKRAILYGNDTDTTACLVGGLAGIKYGLKGIPQRWMDQLRGQDVIQRIVRKTIRAVYPADIAREIISVDPIDPTIMQEMFKHAKSESELIAEGYEPVSHHGLMWIKK